MQEVIVVRLEVLLDNSFTMKIRSFCRRSPAQKRFVSEKTAIAIVGESL